MIYGIYSVKDLKTGYIPPTFEVNDDSAIRNFFHACKNTNSLFFTNPGDFQLWKLGEFDHETGTITYSPEFLVDAPIVRKEGE